MIEERLARVGTNKRYAGSIDRAMSKRVEESVMRGEPATLSTAELELDVYPLTRSPAPISVRAWVRYGAVSIKVNARAVAWTSRAVAIEWATATGNDRAWVWASAVDRR